MEGTTQKYTLDMADGTNKTPLKVKQYDTNSRFAEISLVVDDTPWTVPFEAQVCLNVRKNDATLATSTCERLDEHTVRAPITEQMAAVPGTQQGELYFLDADGDIRSQTFPIVVYAAVMDQDRIESSDDFKSLQDALREVRASIERADKAAKYATEAGDKAEAAAEKIVGVQ